MATTDQPVRNAELQLVAADGVRPGIGTFVAETQHVERRVALGDGIQARHVCRSLIDVEGVEQPAIQHRLERAPKTMQPERIARGELDVEPAVAGRFPGNRQRRLGHVDAHHRQSQRGEVKCVLAAPAPRIEYRTDESATGCHACDRWLRPADVPRRGAVAVRRVPWQSRHPLVTGGTAATERVVGGSVRSLRRGRQGHSLPTEA